ncbi:MAG: type II toxin-antitoxin system VapC family toxin, partial [Desulfotomaculales bacterium]
MPAERIYVDTSALLAVLDASDRYHTRAAPVWEKLVRAGATLVISSYVLVETCAVIQRRLGMEALRLFCTDVCPGLEVVWVDA